ILHMMKEVAVWRRLEHPRARRVGLLATSATILSGLYHRELQVDGVEVVVPDELHQQAVMRAIYGPESVKAGNHQRARQWALRAAEHLLERGCELLILGCTELPVVVNQDDFDRPIIDATDVLAQAAIREAVRDDTRAEV
ncbi:MAG TPA: amino acid racemase, partial [Bacillota bacterium]